MTHKTQPKILRIGQNEEWLSRGFYKKNFSQFLKEDLKIRNFLIKKFSKTTIENVGIERRTNFLKILIRTARPAFIIGRSGDEVKKLKKEIKQDFVIPAFNLRTLIEEEAKTLFRAAQKERVGAFIIELARSEMEYTNQPLASYDNLILKAAQKEKFNQQIFLQADHFKIRNKEDKKNLKNLIKKAIKNNFYNIDIDGSSLSLSENYTLTAEFTKFIRKIKPYGLMVSIGAEVSEIGNSNTTIKNLEEFIKGYQKTLSSLGNFKGLIKIAVQSGTSHGKGGKVDFGLLKKLGQKSQEYGLVGVVQHGASLLSQKEFLKFLRIGVCEIHLATLFQDLMYESKYFPIKLKEKIYQWLKKKYYHERKEIETEKEFFHRLRKKALGPFKKEILKIEPKKIKGICEELEEKFIFFFRVFKVSGTSELIKKIYS